MKKLFLLSLLALFTVGIFSCSTNGMETEEPMSLTAYLNENSSDIDLSEITCNEDAEINKSKKISNGNFNGKILTINSGNVTLENVQNIVIVISEDAVGCINIKNCSEIIIITIEGADELKVADSEVKEIDVKEDNSSIVLVDGTKVEKINVSEKGTSIQSESSKDSESTPVISELTVAPTVDNVDVAGGKIENIVINNSSDYETPSVTATGAIEIEKVETKNEDGTVSVGSIVVSDDLKEEVKLPEDVVSVTIVSVLLAKGECVKYTYEIGDIFDYTDLAVKIAYSDNTEKTVMLNKLNSVVRGFYTNEPGTCTLSFKYKDILVEGTIEITIEGTLKEYKTVLNQGIELICEGHFDEGFTKIKAAYEIEQNDETKMYYALVELASISTDESVNKIMKENLGITNYPAEFNSLISGDWLEKYPSANRVYLFDVYDAEDYYGYVRVDGELCESWEVNSVNIRCYLDDEGDWIDPWRVLSSEYIKNPVVSENGRYLVYKHDVPEIPEGTKYYEYDYTDDYKKILDYDNGSSLLAQFNVPAWLEDTEMYKDSFVGTTATVTTQAYRFYASLVDCNPNGVNELIDNIVNVFNTKFNPVKEIANTISNNSVLIPAKVIETLNLEELLGDSNVKLGKAELNVVIASLQLFKGIFEWISSYDLSANITELKSLFNSNESFDHNFINDIIKVDTFKTRNESAMALSKATFVDALDMLLASYDFIVSSENDYPQAAKDEIKRYGDVLKSACNQLKNSITNGTVFYIPKDNPFETSEWNATKDNCWLGIDMGKLFKAGYFSNIVERTSSGALKIICDVETWTDEDDCDVATFEVTSDMSAESLEAKILQLGQEKYPEAYRWYGRLYMNLNTELLDALLPGLGLNNHDGDGGKMQIYSVRIENENE